MIKRLTSLTGSWNYSRKTYILNRYVIVTIAIFGGQSVKGPKAVRSSAFIQDTAENMDRKKFGMIIAVMAYRGRRMTETYFLDHDLIFSMARQGFKLNMKLSYVADKMPIRDVQRCNKCIRTMFSDQAYLTWLNYLHDYIIDKTKTYPERFWKIEPLIRKEIAKYE